MNPPLILISIQLLLRKYRINSKLYPIRIYILDNGRASISWHLAIIGFNEIRKFYDLCKDCIRVDYKKENIKKILDNQKERCLPIGLRIVYYLINAKKIEDERGYFTSKNLIEITKRIKKTVNNTISYLAQLDLIECSNKTGHLKHWILTEKGMKYLDRTNQNKENWDYLFN